MTTGPVGHGAVLLAAGLVGALLPAGEAVARTAAAPRPPASATSATTATLVTGDKVTVTELGHGSRTVTLQRPRGATGPVRTQSSNGDLTLVPDEALPYLRAGTLDRRLFDVSAGPRPPGPPRGPPGPAAGCAVVRRSPRPPPALA